jgi:hypothetical protein
MDNYKSLVPTDDYKNSSSAYERWVNTRLALYRSIEHLKSNALLNTDSVLILGAGTCKDLPMDYICETFEKVVLVDKDSAALAKSVKYYCDSDYKVTRIICDLTVISDSALQSAKEQNNALDYFQILSNGLDVEAVPEALRRIGEFSLVISDLIVSQLGQPYLDYARERYCTPPIILIELSDTLAKQHYNQLNSLCNENGCLIILQDLLSYGIEGSGSPCISNVFFESNRDLLERDEFPIDIFERFSLCRNFIPGASSIYIPAHSKSFTLKRNFLFWWYSLETRWYLCISLMYKRNM